MACSMGDVRCWDVGESQPGEGLLAQCRECTEGAEGGCAKLPAAHAPRGTLDPSSRQQGVGSTLPRSLASLPFFFLQGHPFPLTGHPGPEKEKTIF